PTPTSTLFPYTTLFRSGGKERVIRGPDKFRFLLRTSALTGGVGRHGASGEEIEAREIVPSDEALDLVENGGRIKRAHLGLKLIRSEEHTSELQSRGHLV